MTITIVALARLTRDVERGGPGKFLSNASEIYVRTARHPTLDGLPSSVKVKSFDYLYEQAATFRKSIRKWPTKCCAWGPRRI